MKSNNIFYFATKELTTDAFLSWIMCYLDSSDKYKKEKQIFFDDFILKEEDKGRQINNVNIKRQENDVDILLEFSFLDDNSNEQVLFEDKTWTSYHGDQLQKYKQLYPDCYRYIYFKLAYVNSEEEKYVKDKGYEIYTSFNITNTLEKIKYIHDLVKMYLQYVNDEFNSKTTSFENELFVKNNYNILWNAEAQKFLCDKIASELTKSEVDYLEIRNGSSFGRPWTQIDIAEQL